MNGSGYEQQLSLMCIKTCQLRPIDHLGFETKCNANVHCIHFSEFLTSQILPGKYIFYYLIIDTVYW